MITGWSPLIETLMSFEPVNVGTIARRDLNEGEEVYW
jgi:hypothetical protein